MTILTIPQLELLIFLKSPIIPKWVLKSEGYGDGYRFYGSGHGFGIGHGYGKAWIRKK